MELARDEVFADGSVAAGDPFPAHRVPTAALVALASSKPPVTRRVPFNPSAGEVCVCVWFVKTQLLVITSSHGVRSL
jgi:hypothetical protein